MSDGFPMDIQAVLAQLPHRYPFLLVDRVVECVPGQRIHAIKNVTINEPIFPGHFPGRPTMPGVMILEALAQAAGILAFKTAGVVPDDKLTEDAGELARLRNLRERRSTAVYAAAPVAGTRLPGPVSASPAPRGTSSTATVARAV